MFLVLALYVLFLDCVVFYAFDYLHFKKKTPRTHFKTETMNLKDIKCQQTQSDLPPGIIKISVLLRR